MDRSMLDQVCERLVLEGASTRDAKAEMAAIRQSGFSVVESIYIVTKIFNVSLTEGKRMAIEYEQEGEGCEAIEKFHEQISDGLMD